MVLAVIFVAFIVFVLCLEDFKKALIWTGILFFCLAMLTLYDEYGFAGPMGIIIIVGVFAGVFALVGIITAAIPDKYEYKETNQWESNKITKEQQKIKQEQEKRQQDYERGNYYGTFEHIKQSLMQNENDAESYRKLGYMYENGYGTTQDYSKAMKCYQKANAWREIGYMHYFGYGVYKNKDKANEYFAKCDDREDCKKVISYFERITNNSNDANALYNLGWHYAEGKGITQDYQKALYYYKKAADLGLEGAYNNLGCMYGSGKGVERDYYTARRYFQKGADLGDKMACDNLGSYYENGTGGGADKYKALKYYKKACDLGNKDGCENFRRLKNEMGITNDDDVLF